MISSENLKRITFPLGASLHEVLSAMTEQSSKVALVTDSDGRLLGVVTDGDVRRSLQNGLDLKESISSVMNKNPVTGRPKDSRRTLLRMMRRKDITHVPIIDAEGIVIDIESFAELALPNPKTLGKKALIMAGGFGKRLLPITESIPKPLVKVGSKSIIELLIEDLSAAGFDKIFVSTFYKAEMIEEFLGERDYLGTDLHFLQEEKPLGTAGGLQLLPLEVREESILVLNADLLVTVDYESLWRQHLISESFVTMCVREIEIEVPFGVVCSEGDKLVDEIREKPVEKFLVNAGMYVVSGQLAGQLRAGEVWAMPDLINKAYREGKKVSLFGLENEWIDIGTIEGLNNARNLVSGKF